MAGAPGDGARQNSCRAPPTTTAYPSSSVDKEHIKSLVKYAILLTLRFTSKLSRKQRHYR